MKMLRTLLNSEQGPEILGAGLSRRDFGRAVALLAAGTMMPFYSEPLLAQMSAVPGGVPADAVKIDANENPMGPCAEALAALAAIAKEGGRYTYPETDKFVATLAEQEGLTPEYVKAYPGSSIPLHHAVIAFTSPEKPFVTAAPGYDAPNMAARVVGSKAIKVPLNKETFAHDVKGMLAAGPNAGLFYICNPNNPSGTATPKEEIESLVENKPKGSVVLIDEAYIHIAGLPTCVDLVAKGKDVIILRTFSKIYGMAGLRAGAAIGRPDLLKQLGQYYAGALPITAMAAATASLKQPTLVAERRKTIAGVREGCLAFLKEHKFDFVPSVSNCFMVDTKKPAIQTITALRQEKIFIGRPFPDWPTHVRVTVGTAAEMEKFKTAFLKVMA